MPLPIPPAPEYPAGISVGKRLGAWAVDFAVLAVVASCIGWATYSLIVDSLRSYTDMGSIGVSNFVSHQGDWLQMGTDAGMDVLRNIRLYALVGLIAVLLVATAYYWLSTAKANRTLGMAVLDVRLVRAGDPSMGPGWTHSLLWALLRAVTDIGVFAAACVAMMFGSFVASFLLWIVSVTWLLFNGLTALKSGRSVVDRIGHVVMVSASGYAAAGRIARSAAGSAAMQAQNLAGQAQGFAGQLQVNRPERVQQTFTAAGQVGKQAVDRTRQAMESERAAQAAEAGRRAATVGRRFAGDMKRRIDDRRS